MVNNSAAFQPTKFFSTGSSSKIEFPNSSSDERTNYYYEVSGAKVFRTITSPNEQVSFCVSFTIGTFFRDSTEVFLSRLAKVIVESMNSEMNLFLNKNNGKFWSKLDEQTASFYGALPKNAAKSFLNLFFKMFEEQKPNEYQILSALSLMERKSLSLGHELRENSYRILYHLAGPDKQYRNVSQDSYFAVKTPKIVQDLRKYIRSFFNLSNLSFFLCGSEDAITFTEISHLLERIPSGPNSPRSISEIPSFSPESMNKLVVISPQSGEFPIHIATLVKRRVEEMSEVLHILNRFLKSNREGSISELQREAVTFRATLSLRKFGAYSLLFIYLQASRWNLVHYDAMVKLVFDKIEFIRKNLTQTHYDESRSYLLVKEMFLQEDSLARFTEETIKSSGYLPPKDTLLGEKEDAGSGLTKVKDILEELKPENSFVFIAGSNREHLEREVPCHNVSFTVKKLTLNSDIYRNPHFVLFEEQLSASSFDDVKKRRDELSAIDQLRVAFPIDITPSNYAKKGVLYYGGVSYTNQPLFTAYFAITIGKDAAEQGKLSAFRVILPGILDKIFDETIKELEEINVKLAIFAKEEMIVFSLEGISLDAKEAIRVLAQKLKEPLDSLMKTVIFVNLRDHLRRTLLVTSDYTRLRDFAKREFETIIIKNTQTLNEMRNTFSDLNNNDWDDLVRNLPANTYLTSMIAGDVSREDASELFTKVADALLADLNQSFHTEKRYVIDLTRPSTLLFGVPGRNTKSITIIRGYYIGDKEEDVALGAILESIFCARLSEDRNSDSSVGGSISLEVRNYYGHNFLRIDLSRDLSEKDKPSLAFEEVNKLISDVHAELCDLSDEIWALHKQRAKIRLSRKANSFFDHCRNVYIDILDGDLKFTRITNVLKAVESFKKESFADLFKEHLIDSLRRFDSYYVPEDRFEEDFMELSYHQKDSQNIFRTISGFQESSSYLNELVKPNIS